jgi:hypothetical protein
MAHTTVNDFEDYAGQLYDAPAQARIAMLIPRAERKLRLRVGQDFWLLDPTTYPEAKADWVYATCVVTDWLLVLDDPETRDASVGPYQSERLGDYSYTLRDSLPDKAWTIWKDMRIRDILVEYSTLRTGGDLVFATAAGRANPRVETTEIGGVL